MRDKVTGVGGIFFKCKDPGLIREWYNAHLGISIEDYGTTFAWNKTGKGTLSGGTFKQDTNYFEPSQKEFMINFRVNDLALLLKQLQESGIEQIGDTRIYEYGKFAHNYRS
jgi:hypothetical protein